MSTGFLRRLANKNIKSTINYVVSSTSTHEQKSVFKLKVNKYFTFFQSIDIKMFIVITFRS